MGMETVLVVVSLRAGLAGLQRREKDDSSPLQGLTDLLPLNYQPQAVRLGENVFFG